MAEPMGSRESVSLPPYRGLLRFALSLAALSLLVAPFRGSAGLRGASMLVAGIVLAILWLRTNGRAGMHFPRGVLLRSAVIAWVVLVFAYSALGSDPLTSLASWRGDVLTPLLAGVVCYTLAQSAKDVAAILITLLCGAGVLTGMVALDPYQATRVGYEAAYLTVGWLSTWLLMLAATLPMAWKLSVGGHGVHRALSVLAVLAILVGCWFSNNRVVWLCFGVMFLIFVATNFQRMRGTAVTRVAVASLGAIFALSMFLASSAMRAAQFPEARVDAVSILQKDDRQQIWTAAIATIAERPLAGHGYALEASSEALASHFSAPGFKTVFRQAHNIVLNYAIQMGLPGALVLLILFGGLAHAFWVLRNQPGISGVAATCGLMLLAGFFLRNMTDDFFHRHAALLLGALIGMLLAVSDWPNEKAD